MPFGPAPLTFIRQRFADAGALDEEIGVLRQVLRDRSIIAMRIKGQVNYWVGQLLGSFGLRFWAGGSLLPGRSKFCTLTMALLNPWKRKAQNRVKGGSMRSRLARAFRDLSKKSAGDTAGLGGLRTTLQGAEAGRCSKRSKPGSRRIKGQVNYFRGG